MFNTYYTYNGIITPTVQKHTESPIFRNIKAQSIMKKEDRRIQRTKQALQDALINLILDKGYEGISVQDIVDRANIGRSTFYSHYSTKDAVFSDSFKPLELSLKVSMNQNGTNLDEKEPYQLSFTAALFSHVDKNRNLYRALTGERGGILATNHIKKILFDLVRCDFESQSYEKNLSKTEFNATIHYTVGAITGVLSWWLDGKVQWNSDKVNEFLMSMITPSLYKKTLE